MEVGLRRHGNLGRRLGSVLRRIPEAVAPSTRGGEVRVGIGEVLTISQHIGPAKIASRDDEIDRIVAVRTVVDAEELAVRAEDHALSISDAPSEHVALDPAYDRVVARNRTVGIEPKDFTFVSSPVAGLHLRFGR